MKRGKEAVKCNKLILYALWNANIRRQIAAINLCF